MRKNRGQIRIIGGQWRSRKLTFPEAEHLRPSPDAVRETLFNWLQNDVRSSKCLDLFAGSGALGFEAASRGAARVVMVENDPTAVRYLNQNRELLNAEKTVTVVRSSAKHFIDQCDERFDLLFLDPPFDSSDLEKSCQQIHSSGILSPGALVYIENPRSSTPLPIHPTWHIIRQKARGLVQSTLIETEHE